MAATESSDQPIPSPAPTARSRRRRRRWVVGGAVALLLAAGTAGGHDAPSTVATASTAYVAPGPDLTALAPGGRVVYEVIGARSALNITYMTGNNMSMAQVASAKLPWRKEVQVSEASTFFVPTVSVQNAGSGTITCRITVDGTVVDEVSSQGAYAMAMCTGSAMN